jgi:hypothetical protein
MLKIGIPLRYFRVIILENLMISMSDILMINGYVHIPKLIFKCGSNYTWE